MISSLTYLLVKRTARAGIDPATLSVTVRLGVTEPSRHLDVEVGFVLEYLSIRLPGPPGAFSDRRMKVALDTN